ncbi:MAG: AAA family ATPase, partial [Symploca sp. SIO2E6]|nr:AAA family ATPase [Symploca sp. SIO2E6]
LFWLASGESAHAYINVSFIVTCIQIVELIMLYELLFKVEPKTLVLIDEPELSLHVGWQVEFIKDLQEITKLADLDILMATHSPDIIQNRWDLTVELKGIET